MQSLSKAREARAKWVRLIRNRDTTVREKIYPKVLENLPGVWIRVLRRALGNWKSTLETACALSEVSASTFVLLPLDSHCFTCYVAVAVRCPV